MPIIGLAGKKQAGKDTVFNTACRLIYPSIPLRFAFADAVKEECSKATGMSVANMEDKKYIFRKLYQWWGTDFRRNLFSNDYWLNIVHEKILDTYRLFGKDCIIFITDVRFKNEADFIRSIGGSVVRILRELKEEDFHISETNLDGYIFDFNLCNTGTLEQLTGKVEGMLKHFNIINNDNNSRDYTKAIRDETAE